MDTNRLGHCPLFEILLPQYSLLLKKSNFQNVWNQNQKAAVLASKVLFATENFFNCVSKLLLFIQSNNVYKFCNFDVFRRDRQVLK